MFKSISEFVFALGRNLPPPLFLLLPSAWPTSLFSRTRLGRPAHPGPALRPPPDRSVRTARAKRPPPLLSLTRGTRLSASSATARRFLRRDAPRSLRLA